uniref:Uncharacterized protein n=1 Tax=Oryza sativa subsp. japonica TaxID=39947 RepID=Q2QMX6_ORYSJ|nr:hypothetical protein LOC_Os12g39690 [Oryza sativa Japonica Group]
MWRDGLRIASAVRPSPVASSRRLLRSCEKCEIFAENGVDEHGKPTHKVVHRVTDADNNLRAGNPFPGATANIMNMVERSGKKRKEERMEEEDESDGWAPRADGEEDGKRDGDGMVTIL